MNYRYKRLLLILFFFPAVHSCKLRSGSSTSSGGGGDICQGVAIGSCIRTLRGQHVWRQDLGEGSDDQIYLIFSGNGGNYRFESRFLNRKKKIYQIMRGDVSLPPGGTATLILRESSCAAMSGGEDVIHDIAYIHAQSGGERLFIKRWDHTATYEKWQRHQKLAAANADSGTLIGNGYQEYMPASMESVEGFSLGCFAGRSFIASALQKVAAAEAP